jgi:MOSC domain-containing protein
MSLTLTALHVYPVKGLKAIELAEARCTERGLENDRRWMVVGAGGLFMSQREFPRMATIWTDLDEDALTLSAPDRDSISVALAPRGGERMRVQVWDDACEALAVSKDADAWLTEYLETPCRLAYMPESTRRESKAKYAGPGKLVGFADAFAYLLTTPASLGDLNRRLAAKGARAVPMNRFRPNLVVAGAEPFAEDRWKRIRIGEAVLRVAKPCARCQVTTTDQASGEVAGPEPLATLTEFRASELGARFGMNLVTEATGTIRVGDAVEVIE